MRISIQFNPNTRYNLDFGYNTSLFSGTHWFTIAKIWLDHKGNVEYGILKIKWIKHYKYWFI